MKLEELVYRLADQTTLVVLQQSMVFIRKAAGLLHMSIGPRPLAKYSFAILKCYMQYYIA